MESTSVSLDTVSSVLGVSKPTLRYWESEGLLRSERSDNNYRRYGARAIIDVSDISLLRQAGVPVRDIPAVKEMEAESLEAYYLDLSDTLSERIEGLLDAQRALNRRAQLIRVMQSDRREGCVKVSQAALEAPFGIAPFNIYDRNDFNTYLRDPYAMRYVLYGADATVLSEDGWILDRTGTSRELLWRPQPGTGATWYRMPLCVNSDDRSDGNLGECLARMERAKARPGQMVARYLLDSFDRDKGMLCSYYRLYVEDLSDS